MEKEDKEKESRKWKRSKMKSRGSGVGEGRRYEEKAKWSRKTLTREQSNLRPQRRTRK